MQCPHQDLCTAWAVAWCSSNSCAVGVATLFATLGLRASMGSSGPPQNRRGPQTLPFPFLSTPIGPTAGLPSVSRTCFCFLFGGLLVDPIVEHIDTLFNSHLCRFAIFFGQQHICLNLFWCFATTRNYLSPICPTQPSSSCTLHCRLPRFCEHRWLAQSFRLVHIVLVRAVELHLTMIFKQFTWGRFILSGVGFPARIPFKVFSGNCGNCCTRVKIDNDMFVKPLNVWLTPVPVEPNESKSLSSLFPL